MVMHDRKFKDEKKMKRLINFSNASQKHPPLLILAGRI